MRLSAGSFVPIAAFACAALLGCEGAPHPPYWTVERDGKTSVLLGTMHAEADASVLAPELWDMLGKSRVLVTEADVRSVDPGEFNGLVTLPAGESVRDSVTDDEWTLVSAALVGIVGLGEAPHLQPWFLESQAIVRRLPPVSPIDATLVERASDDGVHLAFFETWQDQVATLNGVGFDDGLEVLLRTARDPDAAVAEHLTWADAYGAGDVDQMTALAFDEGEMTSRPAYYDDVVFRHDAWLSQVEDEIDTGDAFIATGFMHMLTDRGLPALLEKDGYTLTRR